ncbi:MAG: hypothetical protein GQ527_11625 [Bacteroidales bacterium]|nr:hypothetical protein [Bacteroidales bacterium]
MELLFSTSQHPRREVVAYFKNNLPDLTGKIGFEFIFDKKGYDIPKGIYQVGIGISQDEIINSLDFTEYNILINEIIKKK